MYSEVVENVVQLAYSWTLPGVITGNSPACTSRAKSTSVNNISGHAWKTCCLLVRQYCITQPERWQILSNYRTNSHAETSAYLLLEESWFLLNKNRDRDLPTTPGPRTSSTFPFAFVIFQYRLSSWQAFSGRADFAISILMHMAQVRGCRFNPLYRPIEP